AELRRLRRRDQPRSLVPRSNRHAHARVRGRQLGRLVRRQLPGLRSGSQAPAGRRSGPAASDQISETDEMSGCGPSEAPPPSEHRKILAMCRNIRTLFNFEPPASDEEIRAASLQFVRKLSGFNAPSKAN